MSCSRDHTLQYKMNSKQLTGANWNMTLILQISSASLKCIVWWQYHSSLLPIPIVKRLILIQANLKQRTFLQQIGSCGCLLFWPRFLVVSWPGCQVGYLSSKLMLMCHSLFRLRHKSGLDKVPFSVHIEVAKVEIRSSVHEFCTWSVFQCGLNLFLKGLCHLYIGFEFR